MSASRWTNTFTALGAFCVLTLFLIVAAAGLAAVKLGVGQ